MASSDSIHTHHVEYLHALEKLASVLQTERLQAQQCADQARRLVRNSHNVLPTTPLAHKAHYPQERCMRERLAPRTRDRLPGSAMQSLPAARIRFLSHTRCFSPASLIVIAGEVCACIGRRIRLRSRRGQGGSGALQQMRHGGAAQLRQLCTCTQTP
ncbi:hypothetical protein FI667_g5567, partial [Globisporangium splendens]